MIKRLLAWTFATLLTLTGAFALPAWAADLPTGEYAVQQVTYDDGAGSYGLMVLNTPKGAAPFFSTDDLQMARLTDEAIAEGKTPYLSHDGEKNVLYLTPDFKIEYVHNETETVTDPQTGQPQTIVVRQQSSFWQPFSAVLAANAVSNMMFGPRYYVPPLYSTGGLRGYGGVGQSYTAAVGNYKERNNAPPAAVKNRTQLRTSGKVGRDRQSAKKGSQKAKAASKKQPLSQRVRRQMQSNRSSGSGVGGSNLRSSKGARSQTRQPVRSFGSSRSSGLGARSMARPRSFGGGRRRR